MHQFCRVGAHAFIAAGSIVLQDVPPFVTAAGYPAKPHGTNSEGLRRRGFSADRHRGDQARLQDAVSQLASARARRATQIAAEARGTPVLAPLAAFLETAGRGIIR